MNAILLEQVEIKRKKLEDAKAGLKAKFIGIDDVIDKIIDHISLWYLSPEIQFRPLIVSLWGITGIGKTDLVRTLVDLLGFTDKFIEIQMDTKNEFNKNIENYLENAAIATSDPAILLLDEIQRFRTIDGQGNLLENRYFNDIWMLLSDGKFQNRSQRRTEVEELLLEEYYYQDARDSSIPEHEPPGKKKKNEPEKVILKTKKFNTSFWTANRFKKLLGLDISVEDIMKMTLPERMAVMEDALKSNKVNDGKSYEKLLIFISGNLDDAFVMAEEVEDSEHDADIYHELSKRITIINIKSALAKQFKPEQIARFGNNHVIYPCLDKKSFYKIIKKTAEQILERVQNEHGIKIKLTLGIYDVIYRNGVFPTQGVRPVVSTVFNVLGSNLPHFMYHALVEESTEFTLGIEGNVLFACIGGNIITKEIILDIDNIRKNKSIDEKMLILVHELGHALMYAILFKTPPKQININSAGLNAGFVVNHSSVDNKTSIRNHIAILLSGRIAEEIIFGEEYKSSGAAMDIAFATNAAGNYVRTYGMDGTLSRIGDECTVGPLQMNTDVNPTNAIIELLLNDEKKRASDLMNFNIGTFKRILTFAVDNGNTITVEQFLEICNKDGFNLKQKEINEQIIYSYDEKLKSFLNR